MVNCIRLRRRPFKVQLVALLVSIFAIANIPAVPGNPQIERWKSGDILCLNGNSLRSKVVRFAEGYSADFSHVGIVVFEEGVPLRPLKNLLHHAADRAKSVKTRHGGF